MKTLESRLQNGKVICKTGVSFTKQESYLQNGSLALQMGLLACNLPLSTASSQLNNKHLSKFNKYILTYTKPRAILYPTNKPAPPLAAAFSGGTP